MKRGEWRWSPPFAAMGEIPGWSFEVGELMDLRIESTLAEGKTGFRVSCHRGGFAVRSGTDTHPEELTPFSTPGEAVSGAIRLAMRLLQEATAELDRMTLVLPVPPTRAARETLRRAGVQVPREPHHQGDQQEQPHSAARVVPPAAGVGPDGEGASEKENHQDDQEGSHGRGL